MKTFICEDCNKVYGWVLRGFFWKKCVYCCGAYPDGKTKVFGNGKYYAKWKYWLDYYLYMIK